MTNKRKTDEESIDWGWFIFEWLLPRFIALIIGATLLLLTVGLLRGPGELPALPLPTEDICQGSEFQIQAVDSITYVTYTDLRGNTVYLTYKAYTMPPSHELQSRQIVASDDCPSKGKTR